MKTHKAGHDHIAASCTGLDPKAAKSLQGRLESLLRDCAKADVMLGVCDGAVQLVHRCGTSRTVIFHASE